MNKSIDKVVFEKLAVAQVLGKLSSFLYRDHKSSPLQCIGAFPEPRDSSPHPNNLRT